jgi:hypothetical protein
MPLCLNHLKKAARCGLFRFELLPMQDWDYKISAADPPEGITLIDRKERKALSLHPFSKKREVCHEKNQ